MILLFLMIFGKFSIAPAKKKIGPGIAHQIYVQQGGPKNFSYKKVGEIIPGKPTYVPPFLQTPCPSTKNLDPAHQKYLCYDKTPIVLWHLVKGLNKGTLGKSHFSHSGWLDRSSMRMSRSSVDVEDPGRSSFRFCVCFLVGGFNPSEKYWSNWKSSQSRGENEKYLKPPPSFAWKLGGLLLISRRVIKLMPLWAHMIVSVNC